MGYASYATMAQGFGPGFDAPLIIAAKLPDAHAGTGLTGTGLTGTGRLAAAVAATPGVAAVTPGGRERGRPGGDADRLPHHR